MRPSVASPAPVASIQAPQTKVNLRVLVAGVPLDGASISVRSVEDLAVLADGLTTDSAGRSFVPVDDGLAPGTIVLVQAFKDALCLSGLFLVPGGSLAVQKEATQAEWQLDLASSVVARRLISKLAEVVQSVPPGVLPGAVHQLLAQIEQLAKETRMAMSQPFTDLRAAAALKKAESEPTIANLEQLATALIQFTPLQDDFVQAVDACNRQVMANLAAGGPLVAPVIWQMVNVQVQPPQISVLGRGELDVAYAGARVAIQVADALAALAKARADTTATTTNPKYAAVNTTYVENASSKGGGGGGPPAPPPILADMAFVSDRDGNDEIYVMSNDGTGQTRLTNDAADDQRPAWSPDGTKIAFVSLRDGNREIYAMNADGSGPTRLTNDAGIDHTPAWSPDGTKIAFRSDRDGNNEIYVMNADGSGQINLTNNVAADEGLVWSPDGTQIAFVSTRDGNVEIYAMNADGSGQTRLTNDPGLDLTPAWSPDGTKIAFVSARDGNAEVYLMNADGSGQTRLTSSAGSDASVTFKP